MTGNGRIDFSTILDELIADRVQTGGAAPGGPAIDYLSVADELTGHISISDEGAKATYRDIEESLATLFAVEAPPLEPLPPTDRASVAAELALGRAVIPQELDRIRREFARDNHPDRVPDHMRDCAMIRMQLANVLIDEAKNALLTRAAARSG